MGFRFEKEWRQVMLPSIGDTIDNERAQEIIRRHFPRLRHLSCRLIRHPLQYRPWIFDG